MFLVPRVANLHSFVHLSDNDELISCELCDIIVSSQELDLFIDGPYFYEDTSISLPSTFIAFELFDTPVEKIASPLSFYNKPPPLS